MFTFYRQRIFLMISALLAFAVPGSAEVSLPRAIPLHEVGKVMPAFTVPNVKGGQDLSLARFAGKPLYMVFFAPWCEYCNNEAPLEETFQKKYASSGLVTLAIDEDEKIDKAQAFAQKYNWSFPIGMETWKLAPEYRADILPTHIFIDRHGRLSAFYGGAMEADEIEKELRKITQQ